MSQIKVANKKLNDDYRLSVSHTQPTVKTKLQTGTS